MGAGVGCIVANSGQLDLGRKKTQEESPKVKVSGYDENESNKHEEKIK